MNKLKIIAAALLTSLLLVTGSCVNVKQSPPDKRYYALNVIRTGQPISDHTAGVIRVKSFRVSPLYADKGFVYRNGDLNYLFRFL